MWCSSKDPARQAWSALSSRLPNPDIQARTPLLAQQALNPLPRPKCNPQSGPELAVRKNQTLNLPVGRP
jgi:hypothetical protein